MTIEGGMESKHWRDVSFTFGRQDIILLQVNNTPAYDRFVNEIQFTRAVAVE